MSSAFAPFADVPLAPPDPILGLTEQFLKDTRAEKVNLGVGVYQDENGKLPVLSSVKRAEQRILEKENTKSYIPMDGIKELQQQVLKLILGEGSAALREERAVCTQSVAGSGALRLGMEFIKRFVPNKTLWISSPSWENHRAMAEGAGLEVKEYAYYSPANHGLDRGAMLDSLSSIPAGSVVLLHVCCHNPTGVDLDRAAWKDVQGVVQRNKLIPFFDLAYQGFADGLNEDAEPIRAFAEAGISMLIASSFSKNLGLYRERVGSFTVVAASKDEAQRCQSQVKRVVRSIYSSPPSHGGQIALEVLGDPELRAVWEQELTAMRTRIQAMRAEFTAALAKAIPGRDFSFIREQRGMFSYSGLSAEVAERLQKEFAIYVLRSGRICVAALNQKNLGYVVQSIAKCV